MSAIQITLPEGLVEILREAADIINSAADALTDGLPSNFRYPIIDELQGFAAMLEAEQTIFKKKEAPSNALPLTEEDITAMREALKRIYLGRYHTRLSMRLCDSAMADIAQPFALKVYDKESSEQAALYSIYCGHHRASLSTMLSDTQMAELAKPFVDFKEVEEQIQRDMDEVFAPTTPSEPVQLSILEKPAERMSRNATVAAALEPFIGPDEKVIWLEPFRWFDKNGVLSNHYEGMSVAGLVETFGYEVIADYKEVAIVRSRNKA